MSVSNSICRKRENSAVLLTYANVSRKEGNFNDVIIEAGNSKIPANRMVLSCFSAYFDKMFKVQMKEKFQDTVKILGIDSATFSTVVDYMYSGEILISADNATELLACADYLGMDDLVQFCFEYLTSEISVDNCLTIFATANLYNNTTVKSHTLKFVKKHFGEISQTVDFKGLSKSDLILCISTLNRNHVKEAVVSRSILEWTQYDEENRKKDFAELWNLVNLKKLSFESIGEIVTESLITDNLRFSNMMNIRLVELLKEKRMFENESRILSLGGWGTKTKVIEVYCTAGKSNTKFPDLPLPIETHRALKLNNYVFCFGGFCFHSGLSERAFQLRLNEDCMKWEDITQMNDKRQCFGATVFNDCIIVAGGRNGGKVLSSTEIYDPQKKTWEFSVPLFFERNGNELVVCDGCLYTIGGYSSGEYLSNTERLDEDHRLWESLTPMHVARDLFAVVNCDGEIFAIGGVTYNNKVVKTVERYDFDVNEWMFVSDMHVERCRHAACVLHGRVYVIGGVKNDGTVVTDIECYNPSQDRWEIVGKTKDELLNHDLAVV